MDVDRKTNKETNAAPNTENTYDIHDIQKNKACVIRLSICGAWVHSPPSISLNFDLAKSCIFHFEGL